MGEEQKKKKQLDLLEKRKMKNEVDLHAHGGELLLFT